MSQDWRRLGFYTVEQEADAFALNYLVARGDTPKVLEDMLMHIMTLVQSLDLPAATKTSVATCQALYRRGWRSLRRPYYPVLEDVVDLHHSLCYRLYMVGEMARHLEGTPPLRSGLPSDFAPFEKVRAAVAPEALGTF